MLRHSGYQLYTTVLNALNQLFHKLVYHIDIS